VSIQSYGKVWRFKDHSIRSQFFGNVEIEEKIDGSQFSAMKDDDGDMYFRSKGVEVHPDNPGMFGKAVAGARELSSGMVPHYVYRFEYLSKPKHNTLKYSRTPNHNLILFEVETPDYRILSHSESGECAKEMQCEQVPLLWSGPIPNTEELDALMDTESVLGGEKIEGVVIKARDIRHNADGKVLKAKVVCESFQERHQKDWKKSNPNQKDVIERLGESLNTEARFSKAVQHLREQGEITETPKDIGKIMAEFGKDLSAEETDWVKEQLFKWAWPKIQKRASLGLPQWYLRSLENEEVVL